MTPSPESYIETLELVAESIPKLRWNEDLCPRCGQAKFKTSRVCRKCFRDRVVKRNTGTEKLCTRCKDWFPLKEFTLNRNSPDGLHYWCSTCSSNASNERQKSRIAKEIDLGFRICETCNISKPRSEFSKKVNGIRRICKDCIIHDGHSVTSKRCSKCKKILERKYFYNTAKTVSGLSSACKECLAKLVRERKGLPKDWYEEQMIIQKGKCLVCSVTLVKEKVKGKNYCHVDHDHKCCPPRKYCGKCARGLLCGICNRSIGMIEDNAWFKKALSYLHQFGAMTKLRWVEDDETI